MTLETTLVTWGAANQLPVISVAVLILLSLGGLSEKEWEIENSVDRKGNEEFKCFIESLIVQISFD